ncbi:hypothetical protein [Nonomuraea cavernae]|uniref:hypothetical protein n=1 Tax=Nonomuraea cavernae TaxID=2045107 RepID=UPI0033ECD8B1
MSGPARHEPREQHLGTHLVTPRTGDTYVREADGFFQCLGRSNDMIKVGGVWVSPMEVEARLLEHESVGECAVVAHLDREGLEKPIVCVVREVAADLLGK